jgi:hypothetical protein
VNEVGRPRGLGRETTSVALEARGRGPRAGGRGPRAGGRGPRARGRGPRARARGRKTMRTRSGGLVGGLKARARGQEARARGLQACARGTASSCTRSASLCTRYCKLVHEVDRPRPRGVSAREHTREAGRARRDAGTGRTQVPAVQSCFAQGGSEGARPLPGARGPKTPAATTSCAAQDPIIESGHAGVWQTTSRLLPSRSNTNAP